MTNLPVKSGMLLCLAIMLLAGCGAVDQASPVATAPPPINVTVTILSPQTIELFARLPATVLPWRQVDLAFEEGGVVEEVYHNLGDRVRKGQAMARLDTALLNASSKEADAALVFAVYDHERATGLHEEGSLSERDLNGARFQLEQARAASRTLELRLQRSVLRAPFHAQVAARHVEPGQHVQAGSSAIRLVDSDSVRAAVWVPEAQIGPLAPGRPAALTFDAHPGRVFAGLVGAIGPEADADRRVFPLEVHLPNKDGALRPGMIAEARILSQRLEGVIKIPRQSIMQRKDGATVFVIEDGVARLRSVELGAGENGSVVIASGLQSGEAVVVDGARQLANGDAVRVQSKVAQ